MANDWDEVLVAQEITYTLEVNGKLFVIENVPARVNLNTGEQFFAPDIVERLQQIIWNSEKLFRVIKHTFIA